MTRDNFENELASLNTEIINMGAFVENAIKSSISAFRNNDIELCKKIIADDKKVNEFEKNIESKCLWLIAREQPIASDLRNITTALKIVTDMERIGDHAEDIAHITLKMKNENTFANSSHIPQMSKIVIEMLQNAITAYINSDFELAKKTEDKDDEVDEYFNIIKKEIIEIFKNKPQDIDSAINFLLVIKYMERIADHAVNICEWVEFSKTGEYKNIQIF